jgi:hypothetical protein
MMTLIMIISNLTNRPPVELPDQPNLGSLQLHIVLEGSKPEIWRRLIVPANANLGWIHAVIQLAMGWTNSHLHQFRRGDQVVSDSKFELESFENEPPNGWPSPTRLVIPLLLITARSVGSRKPINFDKLGRAHGFLITEKTILLCVIFSDFAHITL